MNGGIKKCIKRAWRWVEYWADNATIQQLFVDIKSMGMVGKAFDLDFTALRFRRQDTPLSHVQHMCNYRES